MYTVEEYSKWQRCTCG